MDLFVDICQGSQFILPNGQSVDTAGIYSTTYNSITNCDSIIHVHLNLLASALSTLTDTLSIDQDYLLPDGIIVTQPGIYTCNLTTSSGCDSIVEVTLYPPALSTGVVNFSNSDLISLSPIPVQNELFVNSKIQDELVVKVMSITGKLILTHSKVSGIFSIPMSDLPAGVYIVSVFNKTEIVCRKLIEKM